LKILESDPTYNNFTLDGQTVVLEDYLEANPTKEDALKKYIKEGRISIGPFYILPDTYLEDGESMIRNLMMGHNIASKFGRVMKAGYIPDPFGHFAQMPQVLSGFGVNSVLFARGFGNEFENLKLNMEFLWKAPGGTAEILGIHLVKGYGSVANLDESKDPKTGQYTNSILRIEKTARELSQYTCTKMILLNNGSDHLFPQPHLPEAIRQFNAKYGESFGIAEQADFERYVNLVLAEKPKLKEFQGELHGGRYQMLLSGVLSARMWIKQWNKMCENRLERYTEPISTITWMYDPSFSYPRDYIWLAWHWLLRNHPHDSICGCSVDYVHDMDMKTRFGWAEQIGTEIIKNSVISLAKLIKLSTNEGERFPILVYNPSPRPRSTLISLPIISDEKMASVITPEHFKITDSEGKEVFNIASDEDVNERYLYSDEFCYALNFIAENIPPFGIKTYYLIPGEEQSVKEENLKDKTLDGEEGGRTFIENKFYKIFINQPPRITKLPQINYKLLNY
jgi:mannosylglycerate hydrolase